MNKNENTRSSSKGEQEIVPFLSATKKTDKSDTSDTPIIMHEAEIITPQPYGVFALCKIIERLQIN